MSLASAITRRLINLSSSCSGSSLTGQLSVVTTPWYNGQGNRTTFHSQLVSLLELRSFAENHDAADFRRWYTSQCRQRWDTPPEDRRAPRSHGLTGVAMLSSPTSADGISLAALVNLSL